MAPVRRDESFRITALCIRRLCLGYRNKNVIPSPAVRPDMFSATIVIATAFIATCLMLVLLLVLLETIRIMAISHSEPGLDKSAENIADLYTKTIACCPPTFPSEEGTCSVCLDDYNTTTIGRKMPCNHFFHVACIDGWILRSAAKQWPRDVARCPVCKQAVLEEDVPEIITEHPQLIPESERQYSHEMHLAENMA